MTPRRGAGQARACPWGSLHLQALFLILPSYSQLGVLCPKPWPLPPSQAVWIFLVVGALCLRKYLSMQPPA